MSQDRVAQDAEVMKQYGFIYEDGSYSDDRLPKGAMLVPRRPSSDHKWNSETREWVLVGGQPVRELTPEEVAKAQGLNVPAGTPLPAARPLPVGSPPPSAPVVPPPVVTAPPAPVNRLETAANPNPPPPPNPTPLEETKAVNPGEGATDVLTGILANTTTPEGAPK